MGQQAAQEVAQTIGFVEDPELQSYVANIGKRMAAKSERPELPWEFHVVNDASVNAFALPGGFIYVTRRLPGGRMACAEPSRNGSARTAMRKVFRNRNS